MTNTQQICNLCHQPSPLLSADGKCRDCWIIFDKNKKKGEWAKEITSKGRTMNILEFQKFVKNNKFVY